MMRRRRHQATRQSATGAAVADALTGQDAVNLARSFDRRVGLTGIVADPGRRRRPRRRGRCRAQRHGQADQADRRRKDRTRWEDFHPNADLPAGILGKGDIISLVREAAFRIRRGKSRGVPPRSAQGQFDLARLARANIADANMGGISSLMGIDARSPKMKNQIAGAGIDDKIIKRQVAVIDR